ncbi:MAG: alpha-ketoacid dehydrogenase subunit beta [Proteobacteria bacterium]|nr:alpha-ketoacid dehydrogenase subunit beta [Pseudomonadota bacterium]
MAELTYIEALNQAFKEEMRRDEKVVMWGEDLISMNGTYGFTKGIHEEFGDDRIKDTPICEMAIAGMAVGAARRGLRPIGFFMNSGFTLAAFDTLFLKIGCSKPKLPVVMQASIAGPREDNDHGMSPEALFAHAPLWKVVMPSTPYDVKGLMKTAIRDDHQVMFLDHHAAMFSGYSDGSLYTPYQDGEIMKGYKQEVPDEEYLIPFGQADVKREGDHLTLVTFSFMVHHALAAANKLSKEGINVEVIDLRTLVPMDVETVVKSAKKTSRVLIVQEAMKRCGVAGEIAFRLMEEAPDVMTSLKTPIERMAGMNLPLAGRTDWNMTPSADSIFTKVKEMIGK